MENYLSELIITIESLKKWIFKLEKRVEILEQEVKKLNGK